jgi:hypothetical protein
MPLPSHHAARQECLSLCDANRLSVTTNPRGIDAGVYPSTTLYMNVPKPLRTGTALVQPKALYIDPATPRCPRTRGDGCEGPSAIQDAGESPVAAVPNVRLDVRASTGTGTSYVHVLVPIPGTGKHVSWVRPGVDKVTVCI